MAQFSVTLLMPFYLQQLRMLPPSKAGLLMIPIPVTTMIVAPVSGAISDRLDTRYLSSAGMAIISIGIFLLSRLKADTPTIILVINLIVIGLGSGMFQTPNNSAIMGCVPGNRRGLASGMLATMRNAGMVLGAAVAGALFSSRRAYLSTVLSQKGLSGSELTNSAFIGALNFAFTVSAFIALTAVITSFIKGSTKRKDL
jgi:MFS family permease